MQDKEMLEQLADRGWARMQVTLDRNMPQRRRRPILWWWLLLALVTAGGAFTYFGYVLPREKEPAVVQPVALDELKTSPGISSDAQQKPDPEQITPKTAASGLTNTQNARSPAPSAPSVKTELAAPVNLDVTRETDPGEIVFRTGETSPTSPVPGAVETEAPETMVQSSGDPAVATFRHPEFPVVEPLHDRPDWTAVQTPEENPDFKTTPVKMQHRRWLVDAGGLYNSGYGVSGFTLSAVLKRPLGNGNWGIHAGLGLRKQSIPLGLTRNFNGNSLSFDSNGTSNGIPVTGSNSDPESLSLDQVNSSAFNAGYYVVGVVAGTDARIDAAYADASLAVSRNLSARWSLETGVRMGFLLPSQWESLPNSSEALQVANSKFLAASDSGQQVSGKILSPFDLALTGGMKYALNPRINLGLQYHFGVNDLFLLEGVDLRNRVVRVSAGYRF